MFDDDTVEDSEEFTVAIEMSGQSIGNTTVVIMDNDGGCKCMCVCVCVCVYVTCVREKFSVSSNKTLNTGVTISLLGDAVNITEGENATVSIHLSSQSEREVPVMLRILLRSTFSSKFICSLNLFAT